MEKIERGGFGMGRPISRSRLATEIGDRIIEERVNRYVREVTADRFDGTPNWDHAEGGEIALRALAANYAIDTPTEDEAERHAIRRLRERIRACAGRDAGFYGEDDEAILEHLEEVERGAL